jgi:hypothetical protein
MATNPPHKRSSRPRKAPPPPPPLHRPLADGSTLPASEFDVPGEMKTELGLVLWKSLRDVLICSQTEPHERKRLLRPPTENVLERFTLARIEARTYT